MWSICSLDDKVASISQHIEGTVRGSVEMEGKRCRRVNKLVAVTGCLFMFQIGSTEIC